MNLKNIFSFLESDLTDREPRAVIRDEPTMDSESIGDGGAVFISDATDEEFEEYEHNEKKGWGKFKEIMDIIKR